jgi:hypothetical protein
MITSQIRHADTGVINTFTLTAPGPYVAFHAALNHLPDEYWTVAGGDGSPCLEFPYQRDLDGGPIRFCHREVAEAIAAKGNAMRASGGFPEAAR